MHDRRIRTDSVIFNATDPASPQTLIWQDGGSMGGAIHRPRIVVTCDADADKFAKLLSINAGQGSGGSLGPEFDGGLGGFGGGNEPPGDTNNDGVVDGQDLAAIFSAWGTSEPAPDLNDDGTVNALDLATALSSWTP